MLQSSAMHATKFIMKHLFEESWMHLPLYLYVYVMNKLSTDKPQEDVVLSWAAHFEAQSTCQYHEHQTSARYYLIYLLEVYFLRVITKLEYHVFVSVSTLKPLRLIC